MKVKVQVQRAVRPWSLSSNGDGLGVERKDLERVGNVDRHWIRSIHIATLLSALLDACLLLLISCSSVVVVGEIIRRSFCASIQNSFQIQPASHLKLLSSLVIKSKQTVVEHSTPVSR